MFVLSGLWHWHRLFFVARYPHCSWQVGRIS